MKLLNLEELTFVSGAGVIEDMGFKNMTSYLSWAKNSYVDPLQTKINGKDLGIRGLYRDWCHENGFDAAKSAAQNGWSL